MERIAVANQGEIRIDRISELPDVTTQPFAERKGSAFIISHSEQGHHHLLDGAVDVLERTDVPQGAKVLYAIVKEPTKLFQDAAAPHDPVELGEGIYEFRIKREFDPFLQQARKVAD